MPNKAIPDSMLDEAKRMGMELDLDGEIEGTMLPVDMQPEGLNDVGSQSEGEDQKQTPKQSDSEQEQKQEEKVLEKDEDEEKSSDEKDEDSSASKQYVTKAQQAKFQREMKQGFKEMADAIKALATSKTSAQVEEKKEEVQEQVDRISEIATKQGLDPEGLKELFKAFQEETLKSIPLDKLNSLDKFAPIAKNMSEQITAQEIESQFSEEWTSFLPDIARSYPNATDAQREKAKELMKKLATSEDYGYVEGKHEAYPLSYILFKEGDKFKDVLFSPKKKTAESSQLGEADDFSSNGENLEDLSFEDLTPDRAAKLTAELHKSDKYD
jgi:hypothetical protein